MRSSGSSADATSRPRDICTHAAIGIGSSERSAPLATVVATLVRSSDGRKTRYTMRESACSDGLSMRP